MRLITLFTLFSFVSAKFLRNNSDLTEGLGGCELEILCAPSQVPLNTSFTVNFKYQTQFPRHVDIHFDILNAISKEWYVGTEMSSKYPIGYISTNITIPPNAKQPFIYKVFVTPYNEHFPNMLAEKGLFIIIGDTVKNECKPFKNHFKNLTETNFGDYLEVEHFCKGNVTVKYNLESNLDATLIVDHMNKEDYLLSYAYSKMITNGTDIATMKINNYTQTEDSYIVVSIVPVNGNWTERLAETRTYNLDKCW